MTAWLREFLAHLLPAPRDSGGKGRGRLANPLWERALSRLVLALAFAAGLAACAATDERPAARAPAPNAAAVYVQGVLDRLARTSEERRAWSIAILDIPDVNAFAFPDGRVFVTRGLLALLDNEAQLAAVVGHEMGHVTARHAEQRRALRQRNAEVAVQVGRATGDPRLVREIAALGVLDERAYSRDQEFEADRIGIAMIGRAGYDVDAAIAVLSRLREHSQLEARLASRSSDKADPAANMLSTHPRTIDRVKAARDLVASAKGGGAVNRDRHLDAIDGMLFGDEPRQGYARGRDFLHPEMGFAFSVPPGFRLLNSPSAVAALGPDDSEMVFTCRRDPGDGPIVDTMRRMLPRVSLADARPTTIGGMEAAIGRRPIGAGDDEDFRVVAVRFTPNVCVFLISAAAFRQPDRGEELVRAAQTFRRLDPRERAQLRPLRLKIVAVAAGDTPQSLAARMPLGENALDWFNTLNGLEPGAVLRPGQRVKTVVAD
ncbi:MAG: peptidase M48 [Alphaproteobacteria bacterium]|nr:peptidase M48 [Alphaproteobacteria bacterium]